MVNDVIQVVRDMLAEEFHLERESPNKRWMCVRAEPGGMGKVEIYIPDTTVIIEPRGSVVAISIADPEFKTKLIDTCYTICRTQNG